MSANTSGINELSEDNSTLTAAGDGGCSVPSTVSSGYESDGTILEQQQQVYTGVVAPYPHILQAAAAAPPFNSPLVFHQPPPGLPHQHTALNRNNSQPPVAAVDQPQYHYSMLPGQPYTAPIMIGTREQIDYAIAQQINDQQTSHDHQSHDRQPVYQYRPFSGPIHITNAQPHPPAPTNSDKGGNDPPPLIIPHQNVYQLPYGGNGVSGAGNMVILNTSHQPPPPMKVTQSLKNFEEHNDPAKPLRRTTLPNVDMPKKNRKELYRRSAAVSMKEKNLCEEEEDTSPMFTIGEDFGGYDYQFLLSPEDLQEVTCPICQLVLCEPFLTSCCGSQFCRDCVNPLLLKKSPCPMCNHGNLSGMVDRRTERKINSLPVNCTKSSLGCTWTGSLSDLHEHLSHSRGSCDYVIVPCSNGCGEEHSLLKMKVHQSDECKRRKHPCKFCEYIGIYEDIIDQHWPVCEGYPVPCPQGCSTDDMPRRAVKQHLLVCPKRVVKCCFSYAGCSAPLQGDEVMQHMNDSVSTHLNLLSEMVRGLLNMLEHQKRAAAAVQLPLPTQPQPNMVVNVNEERNTEIIILNQKLNEKETQITNLKSQITSLQEDNEETKLELARVKSNIYIPPFTFSLPNFSRLRQSPKQWFSPSFYTHPQGYKMCVGVDCNGADEGEGTHVSVYANLMRGEFDDSVSWPFIGVITVQLYNRLSESHGHVSHDIPFRRGVHPDISGRVMDQELADSGLGVPQFITHTHLMLDRHANTEYLKEDTLRFCVSKVKLN